MVVNLSQTIILFPDYGLIRLVYI